MSKNFGATYEVVLCGGSAGSMKPFLQIAASLPATFSLPVIVVLHLHPDSDTDTLMQTFPSSPSRVIKEVEDKEPIKPGVIYIAPANYHVLVEEDRTLSLNVDDKVHFSRPSIDVLFQSAGYVYGSGIIGIIFSGANNDGASGLESIEKVGGLAVIQDPETAEFEIMPRAAMKKCPAGRILPASEISRLLLRAENTV